MAASSRKSKPAAKKKAAKKTTAKKKASAKKTATKKKAAATESRSVPDEISLDIKEEVKAAPAAASAAAAAAPRAAGSSLFSSVRERDITAFLRQLIMLLESGTPMLKALKSISERGSRPGIRNMVRSIAQQVESGVPLWQAFAQHQRHFQPVFVQLVKAGEASGNVITILKRNVEFREKRAMLARRMQSAMLYPAVLAVFCFAVVVLLAKFVIPQFVEIFNTFDVEPEGMAARFINGILWFGDNWYWIVITVVAVVAVYRLWFLASPVRRMYADRIKMKIPIFGPIARRAAIVDFCRTFSILNRSGLSMMVTLDLCRNAVSNRALVNSIQDMRSSVERGEGLEKPLRVAERSGVFPGVVVDMLVTGEEAGTIDNIAEQIAIQYEEEVEIAVDALGEAIQPVATVFMGLIVGAIVFALFGPLIEMIERLSAGTGV